MKQSDDFEIYVPIAILFLLAALILAAVADHHPLAAEMVCK